FQILIRFLCGYTAAMRRTAHRKPRQIPLPWPGTEETCPRCHGTKRVYHRATPNGVEIVGGKRIACPACQAVGTVRTPSQAHLLADAPAPVWPVLTG
ncbi:MAG TPA: hypothetical protein VME47_05190, partial [Acetobacteraceae bacterium]|nr:hypothetical protein [Acetobacteraceae bacterium]